MILREIPCILLLLVSLDVPVGPVARHLSTVSVGRLLLLEGDSCEVSGLGGQL